LGGGEINNEEIVMNAIAAIAVRTVGAGGVAALLSLGVAGSLAHAASSSSQPATSANPAEPDPRSDRRAVRRAVFEAEADVLGIKPATLRDDLKRGQKISDLARDKGMTKEQFADKLAASLRPRLEQLIGSKEITRTQADRVIDTIKKGHIPFWNGRHLHKPASTSTTN
jgi:uncharacterized protein YaiL (DUF2058 family)